MNIQIIHSSLKVSIWGFSGTVVNENYGQTGVGLMDKMWAVVNSKNLKSKGINIWVYEPGMKMMAGVELESVPPPELGLESKTLALQRYAYWKHIGSYDQLKQVNADMRAQLESMNITYQHPCLEIYGHHVEGRMPETEIIWAIK